MRRGALAFLALGALLPTCVSEGPGADSPPPAPPPGSLLSRPPAADQRELTFPPESDDHRTRRPLGKGPSGGGRFARLPSVASPYTDGPSPLDITGNRLRIEFTEPMLRPGEGQSQTANLTKKGALARPRSGARIGLVGAPPGTLTIRPEVPIAVTWLDASTLEMVAKEPLKLGERYTVTLGDVKSERGEPLADRWEITVVPRVEIAGKILSYVPVQGAPKVVTMTPGDGATVGPDAEIAVLFDQPIDLAAARRRLHLGPPDGPETILTAAHPTGPTFEGVAVDPRFVVKMRPAAPLARGTRYRLKVDPADANSTAEARAFDVARPLAVTGVACGGGDDGCAVEGNTVSTSGVEVDIVLNNDVANRRQDLARLIQVTPPVRNLSVTTERWEETRIRLSGAFEPSQRYEITVAGLRDRYGSLLTQPYRAILDRDPLDASVTMPAGVLLLDEARLRAFEITSRNAEALDLSFWPVDDDGLPTAVRSVRAGSAPEGAPAIALDVPVAARENELITTRVDLTKVLEIGRRYIARARVKKATFGADAPGPRATEPLGLVFAGAGSDLALHVEKLGASAFVHVARMGTGEPVPGAQVALLGDAATNAVATGPDGIAALAAGTSGWLSVTSGSDRALLDLARPDTSAQKLFPSLAAGVAPGEGDRRAVLFTDRGIYRPGATVNLFASVRKAEGQRLAPVAGSSFVLRAIGPAGDDVFRADATASDLGSAAASFTLPKSGKVGRHRVLVQAGDDGPTLAETVVQVAEFEPPRFTVDVDATPTGDRALRATVLAKYLFGAPMEGAAVKWTARREPAAIAEGPYAGRGFAFTAARETWDERPKASVWSRSGELTARADGTARVEQPLSLDGTSGPQRFVVEAEVTDSSNRAISARSAAIVHPAARYAGVRISKRWSAPGVKLPVELAVVDREGHPVAGADVTARLRRVVYTSIARRDGAGLTYVWTRTTTPAGSCTAKSDAAGATCDLAMPTEGDYEIAAEVDGKVGGAVSAWAMAASPAVAGGSTGSGPRLPDRGRAVELVPDRNVYTPGDTAKLLVTSPFPAATAIVTSDAPGAAPRSVRIDGSAGVVEIPITGADAPHVHAMVTLLPLAARAAGALPAAGAVADYRIGAVRLPVTASDARLRLDVTPGQPSYRPRDEAKITFQLADAKGPVRGAEIAVAVVDEGMLRMTGFHAPDPVTALRPGRAFSADVFDTRASLGDLVTQSHVAGDGDDHGKSTPAGRPPRADTGRTLTEARRAFAQTAFWKPDVRTDAEGRATVSFPLPDNLTDFRVMAIALDADGRGATTETSFTVTKPMLLVPAVPRFVTLGDHVEAATLVHNNTGTAQWATVSMNERESRVLVPANGHVRVPFPLHVSCDDVEPRPDVYTSSAPTGDDPAPADDPASDDDPALAGETPACPTSEDGAPAALHLRFEVRSEAGDSLDAVEQSVPATLAGLDEQPRVEGAFSGARSIALRVPAHAIASGAGDSVVLTLGAQMWPELGERLRFLLDYPHGCVEQTTSSTLPLLAARDIAPKLGMEAISDADLRTKIQAGIQRLVTMRTPSGGLAYWPQGSEPNTYGTAYAMRVLVLAKAAGIEPPADLLDGMASYLRDEMLKGNVELEVQAAIAQSLAELGRLEPASADALFDRRREQTVFGAAALALAFATLPGQEDRVADLLDRVEAGLTAAGDLVAPPRPGDFYHYGSPVRTKAQAAMALRALRPSAAALPALVRSLSAATTQYTTQATAYSLLALAGELRGLAAGAADATVWLDGRELAPARELTGAGRQFEIPLADLAGKEATLELRSASPEAVGFVLRSTWRRPAAEVATEAFHTERGPEIHRVYTTPRGEPVDLATVRAGDVIRVAIIVRRPEAVDEDRFGFLAITDRLPAGFEPVQQDLATVSSQPDLGPAHPFAAWLLHPDERPSHLELRDDRAQIYFDTAEGDDVAATYLIRATTPGKFALPPATAELMYEPRSLGVTEPGTVIVR